MKRSEVCIGAKIRIGIDGQGKKTYIDVLKYDDLIGFLENGNHVMIFYIKNVETDEIRVTEEVPVEYIHKTRKFINITKHIQVTKQTVLKGRFNKLSGLGNEPRKLR